MKKIIKYGVGFSLIIAIILSIPLLFGIVAQSQVSDFMIELKDQNFPFDRISLLEYKRGWFKSTATLNTPVHQQTLTIYHGPVIFHDGKKVFGLAELVTESATPSTHFNISTNTILNYDTSINGSMQLAIAQANLLRVSINNAQLNIN